MIATPPPSYGEIGDDLLCRRVRVPVSSSLLQIKKAILKTYEDQYKPGEIELYTRKYDDEPRRVSTDRVAKTGLLSYDPDWAECQLGDAAAQDGTVLLVVSAMDDAENKLLVIPAAHSAPEAALLGALAPPPAAATEPIVRSLALQPGLFDPLPLPSHIDDWLAQYREAPQTVRDLMQGLRARPTAKRTVIYLQPIGLARRGGGGGGGSAEASEASDQRLFEGLRDYLGVFFLGTPVVLQPMLHVVVDRGRGHVLGKEVSYRDYCPANEEAQPQGQLDAGMLLQALKPRTTRGATKGGALPEDGFAVLGVTTMDLYSSDDDVFTGGLACLTSRAGVFSFFPVRRGRRQGARRRGRGAVARVQDGSARAAPQLRSRPLPPPPLPDERLWSPARGLQRAAVPVPGLPRQAQGGPAAVPADASLSRPAWLLRGAPIGL